MERGWTDAWRGAHAWVGGGVASALYVGSEGGRPARYRAPRDHPAVLRRRTVSLLRGTRVVRPAGVAARRCPRAGARRAPRASRSPRPSPRRRASPPPARPPPRSPRPCLCADPLGRCARGRLDEGRRERRASSSILSRRGPRRSARRRGATSAIWVSWREICRDFRGQSARAHAGGAGPATVAENHPGPTPLLGGSAHVHPCRGSEPASLQACTQGPPTVPGCRRAAPKRRGASPDTRRVESSRRRPPLASLAHILQACRPAHRFPHCRAPWLGDERRAPPAAAASTTPGASNRADGGRRHAAWATPPICNPPERPEGATLRGPRSLEASSGRLAARGGGWRRGRLLPEAQSARSGTRCRRRFVAAGHARQRGARGAGAAACSTTTTATTTTTIATTTATVATVAPTTGHRCLDSSGSVARCRAHSSSGASRCRQLGAGAGTRSRSSSIAQAARTSCRSCSTWKAATFFVKAPTARGARAPACAAAAAVRALATRAPPNRASSVGIHTPARARARAGRVPRGEPASHLPRALHVHVVRRPARRGAPRRRRRRRRAAGRIIRRTSACLCTASARAHRARARDCALRLWAETRTVDGTRARSTADDG